MSCVDIRMSQIAPYGLNCANWEKGCKELSSRSSEVKRLWMQLFSEQWSERRFDREITAMNRTLKNLRNTLDVFFKVHRSVESLVDQNGPSRKRIFSKKVLHLDALLDPSYQVIKKRTQDGTTYKVAIEQSDMKWFFREFEKISSFDDVLKLILINEEFLSKNRGSFDQKVIDKLKKNVGRHVVQRENLYWYRLNREFQSNRHTCVTLENFHNSLLVKKVCRKSLPKEMISVFKESELALRLNSPFILTPEMMCRGGAYFPYQKNGDLSQVLNKQSCEGKALSYAECTEVLYGVAKALEALHLNGIIHRDIKPENVLIKENGKALLCDLGCSVLEEQVHQENHQVTGTGLYLPPEVYESNPYSYSLDIWSFGVVLFEILFNEMPFPEHLQRISENAERIRYRLRHKILGNEEAKENLKEYIRILNEKSQLKESIEFQSMLKKLSKKKASNFDERDVNFFTKIYRSAHYFQRTSWICHNLSSPVFMHEYIKKNSLMSKQSYRISDSGETLMGLLFTCLQRDPRARPQASEIVEYLEKVCNANPQKAG